MQSTSSNPARRSQPSWSGRGASTSSRVRRSAAASSVSPIPLSRTRAIQRARWRAASGGGRGQHVVGVHEPPSRAQRREGAPEEGALPRIREVVDGQRRHHRVVRAAQRVGQVVGRADLHPRALPCESLAGPVEHVGGEVEEDEPRPGPAGQQPPGQEPGAGAQVEDARRRAGREPEKVLDGAVEVVEAGDELAPQPVVTGSGGVEGPLDAAVPERGQAASAVARRNQAFFSNSVTTWVSRSTVSPSPRRSARSRASRRPTR